MNFLNERAFPAPRAASQMPVQPAPARLRFLPSELIESCRTYREACVLAWKHRTYPGMTISYLSMTCDLYQQHASEYFHPDEKDAKGRTRRSLPAPKIGRVQEAFGNCAIAQWLARDMALRLVEEFFAAEQR